MLPASCACLSERWIRAVSLTEETQLNRVVLDTSGKSYSANWASKGELGGRALWVSLHGSTGSSPVFPLTKRDQCTHLAPSTHSPSFSRCQHHDSLPVPFPALCCSCLPRCWVSLRLYRTGANLSEMRMIIFREKKVFAILTCMEASGLWTC